MGNSSRRVRYGHKPAWSAKTAEEAGRNLAMGFVLRLRVGVFEFSYYLNILK